jgi:ADP-ribose pyrophosphatase
MVLKPWDHLNEEKIADLHIFTVNRLQTRSPRTGRLREVTRIETGDWINVVALTPDEEVVMVRQFRHGTRAFTLEIPGGLIDPGETPAEAAVRELREETGYAGEKLRRLGTVTPNPAFLSNRCHTFLVEQCRSMADPEPDAGEDIEVVLHPLVEIPELIASSAIDHALVICGFWWLVNDRQGVFRP